jgi:hypothetical protein
VQTAFFCFGDTPLAVSPQGICIMKIVAASLPQEIADAASALEEERLEEDPRETTAINTGYTLVLTLQLDLMPKVQNTLGEYGLCRSNQRYSSPTSRPLLRHNARGNHENHRAGSYTNRQRGRAGIRCWCPGPRWWQDGPGLSIPPTVSFRNLQMVAADARKEASDVATVPRRSCMPCGSESLF